VFTCFQITHGFDDSGSQFDGQGNLNNWWSDTSRTNFEERAQCMVDQYSSITWDEAGGMNVRTHKLYSIKEETV